MQKEQWRKALFGCCETTKQRMAGAKGGWGKSMLQSFCIQLIQPMLQAPACQLWPPYFIIKRKFKNKLWVTESDQIGHPRHQYGKSFLSSKLSMSLAAAPQAPNTTLPREASEAEAAEMVKKKAGSVYRAHWCVVTSAKPAQKDCSANASFKGRLPFI